MVNRISKYTIGFGDGIGIHSYASVAGEKEANGPIGNKFHKIIYDSKAGKETFEQAESEFQREALMLAMSRGELTACDIDFIFSGDLLNQCISSSFGLKGFSIPYFGLYGACSTMALGLILGSITISSGAANLCACVTSSHFGAAERQYRFPLEYGGQRTPTAQWTVTAAGCCILSSCAKGKPRISAATVGRIADKGVTDANNMGAAMAPAAAQTLCDFFRDTNSSPEDFDHIYTGDLGFVGSDIFHTLTLQEGFDVQNNHTDCGTIIFSRDEQDVHAGGSGCGCAASTLCSHILSSFEKTKGKRILFMPTGALMSPTSAGQGLTIPAVAHLVEITN